MAPQIPTIGVAAVVFAAGCTSDGAHRACGGSSQEPCSVVVVRETFGQEWPFSVAKGVLACRDEAAVTFTTGDDIFGLNAASSYPPPFPIWQWDAHTDALDLRKTLKPLIDHGRDLCEG